MGMPQALLSLQREINWLVARKIIPFASGIFLRILLFMYCKGMQTPSPVLRFRHWVRS